MINCDYSNLTLQQQLSNIYSVCCYGNHILHSKLGQPYQRVSTHQDSQIPGGHQ